MKYRITIYFEIDDLSKVDYVGVKRLHKGEFGPSVQFADGVKSIDGFSINSKSFSIEESKMKKIEEINPYNVANDTYTGCYAPNFKVTRAASPSYLWCLLRDLRVLTRKIISHPSAGKNL